MPAADEMAKLVDTAGQVNREDRNRLTTPSDEALGYCWMAADKLMTIVLHFIPVSIPKHAHVLTGREATGAWPKKIRRKS